MVPVVEKTNAKPDVPNQMKTDLAKRDSNDYISNIGGTGFHFLTQKKKLTAAADFATIGTQSQERENAMNDVKSFTEWDKDTTAVLTDFAAENEGKVRYEDVNDLVDRLPAGVKPRQVVAKLVSLERAGKVEYVRKEKAKKPRGEDGKPVTKASMSAAIGEALSIAEDDLDGLSKAPARALSAILAAVSASDDAAE